MYSQRDLVQAYLFSKGRLVSALVRGEPDLQQTPMRRGITGTLIGLLIGILVCAGFAVYGLVVPGGNKDWQEAGSIVVEKETGNRYLYLDGTLRPVLNFASAKLGAGQGAKVRSVSRNSLSGVPHGQPIGIPNAPDVLPQADKLAGTSWLVCASSIEQRTAAGRKPGIAVAIGDVWPVQSIEDDRGALVKGGNDVLYLVWRDIRFRITDTSTLVALGYANAQPLAVDSAWFNALELGPDLVAPDIPGLGTAGPAVGSAPSKVGQLYEVRSASGGTDLFVVRADGLSSISATDAALLQAKPGMNPPSKLTAAAAARAPRSAKSTMTDRFPPSPPALVPGLQNGERTRDRALCARMRFTDDRPSEVRLVTADRAVVDSARSVAVGLGGADAGPDSRLADQIHVQPEAGLLAAAAAAPGVATGTKYLITDTGVRYPLGDEAVDLLGYSDQRAQSVPTRVLSLLPTGPALDPEQARVERTQ